MKENLAPFGLSFLPDSSPSTKSATTYYNEAFALCQIADDANFSYVKMTEHYLKSYGGYCPSPLNFLTGVACQTKKIKLLTGCVLPVFHHPISLASEIAMVDAISNGRLEVGFARAYLPYEFESFKIPMNESRERFEATIRAVKRLLDEDAVTENTPYFSFENATILPKTTLKKAPPFWAAAVNSRETFAWIGENGLGLLVTPPFGEKERFIENLSLFRESQDPKKPLKKIAISVPLLIDSDFEKAMKKGKTYIKHYHDVWLNSLSSWLGKSSKDYPGYEKIYHYLKSFTPDKMIESDILICGDPQRVTEKINSIQEKYGIDIFLWQIDFGSQPLDVMKTTLDLFIKEVMPNLVFLNRSNKRSPVCLEV